MKRLFILYTFLFSVTGSLAIADYYVDVANGNDNDDGVTTKSSQDGSTWSYGA